MQLYRSLSSGIFHAESEYELRFSLFKKKPDFLQFKFPNFGKNPIFLRFFPNSSFGTYTTQLTDGFSCKTFQYLLNDVGFIYIANSTCEIISV